MHYYLMLGCGIIKWQQDLFMMTQTRANVLNLLHVSDVQWQQFA